MAKVFVSHASDGLDQAGQVYRWLVEAGQEVFLDRNRRDGIPVGEEWRQRLHERLRWADVVVCVVTSEYLTSRWCAAEVEIARSRGSRLMPLRAEPGVVDPSLESIQHIDMARDPVAACTELVEALRKVDAAGGWGWPDGRSPFPGLHPFDIDQHRVFFGRTNEKKGLAKLLRSMADGAEGAMVLVAGPSGCGKSSLVRAGLLPVMAEEPGWWRLEPMRPGANPVATLISALANAARQLGLDWTEEHLRHQLNDSGLVKLAGELLLAAPAGSRRRLLVVVDQFEEVLAQTASTERARFAELLRPALAGPVQVVATLRPEFLDQLLLDPELAALPTRTYTLRPLPRAALRSVIEGPARLAGIKVDEYLVARLVADTDSGEALPLLAFTLAELADGVSRGGQLSAERYDKLGGVQGALTRKAAAALDKAVEARGRSREDVIAGLLRLVTVDEQGHPTRWRVLRDGLPVPVVTELDVFVAQRLLTTDTDNGTVVIGVAHEAFLSAWPPLAQAIAANASGLRARRAVEHAATEWCKNGRPRERLWGSGQLAAAVTDTGARICVGSASPAGTQGRSRWLPRRRRVLVTNRVAVSLAARDFLHASIRRDRYRRRRTTTILSVLLVLALVAAGVAVYQQGETQKQQRIATARQLITQADAIRETDPRTALLLGIAAQRIRPSGETQASLVNTLTTTRYAGTLTDHTAPVTSVAFSRDGRMLATGDSAGTVILWDLTDLARLRQSLTGHTSAVNSVAFSPDGRTLATGDSGGTVIVWDLADPARPRQSLAAGVGSVSSVAFSLDARTLATGSVDGTAIVWDLTDPAQPRRFGSPLTGHADAVFAVAFSPDGRILATGDSGGTVIVGDLTDPARPRQSLAAHASTVNSVAFSPDGRTLATGSDDSSARLWDLADVAQPQPLGPALTSHTGRVTDVAFAPDGRTLATASDDSTARLWDLADMAQPQPLGPALTSHTSGVTAVAFAPGGRTLATGSFDGTVILWDLTARVQPQRLGQPLAGQPGPVDSVMFVSDGRALAITSSDGTVIQRDFTDPDRPPLRPPRTRSRSLVDSLASAPDGNTMVTASGDGDVILWDLSNRTQPRRFGPPLTGHRRLVTSAAFSADGGTLATASDDGTVILWDLTDRTQPRPLGKPLTGHAGSVTSVAFAPDRNILATGGSDATVILWDLTDLHQLRDHPTERACAITKRGLDPAEWDRYIPGLPHQDTCHLITAGGDGAR